MGTLSLYSNVSGTYSILWSQSGNKGNQWLNGKNKLLKSYE
jgi:hypothetical protein